jgi:hypothetical protein
MIAPLLTVEVAELPIQFMATILAVTLSPSLRLNSEPSRLVSGIVQGLDVTRVTPPETVLGS